MGTRWIAALRIVPVLAAIACGQTLVVKVPNAPALPFLKERRVIADPDDADPRVVCEFMTVMIDFSRHGEIEVAARVARAMEQEFESLGTRITTSKEAYWSLMILASDNSRRDGYIFSAMLSARNMNEGYDPGVTVFQREDDRPVDGKKSDKVPTLYNGLSYGPYEVLEEQSRQYVRQAYAAIFPYAQQLCAFEAADKQREQTLDAQLPAEPAPL
jgi:hypothetical protein